MFCGMLSPEERVQVINVISENQKTQKGRQVSCADCGKVYITTAYAPLPENCICPRCTMERIEEAEAGHI